VSSTVGDGSSDGDPDGLLTLVFARPQDALVAAHAQLANRPSAYSASIAYQAIGLVERDFGDASAAIGHLRRAVRLARQSGSSDREGDALAALGIALIHGGRTVAGLHALQTAVSCANGLTAARVRFRLAGALWLLGRHREALDELRPAIIALRQAHDTIWTARALTLRGLLRLARGATDPADRDFRTAERLFATTGQEHDSALAVHNRGLVAFRAGDLPAALDHFDEASRRFAALGTAMPELSVHRCGVLLAAGLSLEALGEADTAIARLEELRGQATRKAELLLVAARAALAAGDPGIARARAGAAARLFASQQRDWWTAHCKLLLLQARLAAGPASAQLAQDAARTAEHLTALGSAETAQARLLAGRTALLLARPAAAEHHLAIAAQARHRGPALSRVSGWLAEALLAELRGQTRRTLDACRRGLAVLHAYSLTLGASELRAQATAHGLELSTLAQRICLQAGPSRRLLGWSEQWRATALAVPPVRPPDDRELQAHLARYREVTSRLESARAEGSPVAQLEREQQQLERTIRAMRMRVPGTVRPTAAALTLDIGALLTELGAGQLAEIIEVDGGLHVLLCGQGRVRRIAVGPAGAAAAEIEYARSALHRLAYGAATRPKETIALLESAGRTLGDLLLGDAARHLGDGPIVIVPPGRLQGVPWAIIPPLRESALTVAPSARAWLRARSRAQAESREVVVVGGPGLPAGAGELASIAGLYDQVTVLQGSGATAARVLEVLDGAWLAHVAAHGRFRADSPLFSALRMDDGPLTVHDIERLRQAPHRLILPCCDSARLATAGADELLGLSAALLPLGTVGIVASVGPVNDTATAGLMRLLHVGLRRGLTTAEALRDARSAMAADPIAAATAWSFIALGAA
jgi:tetratricopeptide (TPR) repeat protein